VFIGAGFEFAAVVAVLTCFGWWLDGKWGTAPWLLIVGLSIGVIGETYKFYRMGKRFFR
jgi:F0F1-type ATP synthase assembly protein I